MRFDDSLETVLASDLTGEGARASAWRQLVDLIGRGRASPDPRAIALLRELRDGVPRTVRVASARDLEYARPPAELVDLLATDVIEAAVPVLRSATLSVGEWLALLPRLGSAARGVVRNRRDLDPAVTRALDSFGSTDLVLGDERAAEDVAASATSGHPREGWGLSPQPDDARPAETPASAGTTAVVDVAETVAWRDVATDKYLLLATDGTPAGTRPVTLGPLGAITAMHADGKRVYVAGRDADTGARGMWATDGTPAGTHRIATWGTPTSAGAFDTDDGGPRGVDEHLDDVGPNHGRDAAPHRVDDHRGAEHDDDHADRDLGDHGDDQRRGEQADAVGQRPRQQEDHRREGLDARPEPALQQLV